MRYRRSLKRMVTGVCLLCLAGAALADRPRFGDTVSFALGGMNHRGNALLAATRDDAPVDRLRFRDLGLDNETDVVWGEFNWQFFERWRFGVSYSSFDANGFTRR